MLDALVSQAMAGDVFAVAACAPPARKQRDRSAERSRHRLGTREARRLVGSRMDRMAFLELLARHGGQPSADCWLCQRVCRARQGWRRGDAGRLCRGDSADPPAVAAQTA